MDILQSLIKESIWRFDHSKIHVKTLESGLHSDLYLNTDYFVSNPKLVESIVKNFFVRELHSRNIKPDWIISYPPYGLPIAFELAKQVNAKFGYVNTKDNECYFDIKDNDSIIIIGDDIYSGGSIKKTIEIVTQKWGNVKSPVLTIGNFTGTKSIMDLDVISVVSEKGNLYEEDICPMCKLGSKPVSPRIHWKELKEE